MSVYRLLGNLQPQANYRILSTLTRFGNGHNLPAKCYVFSSCIRNASSLSQSSTLLKRRNNSSYLTVTRSLEMTPSEYEGKFSSTKTLKKIQMADRIPPRYEMIYRTDLGNYFVVGQCVVILVVLGVVGSLLIKYAEWMEVHVVDNEKQKEVKEVKPSETQTIFQEIRDSLGHKESEYVLKPKLEELTDGDPESLFIILLFTASLFVSLWRMLRRLPIRIYTNSSGHCMGVYYSSLIPGRTRVREFVAGTLVSQENPRGFLWSHNMFKDGTGSHMLLMEEYFRYPQDFYNLLEKKESDTSSSADGA